MEPELSPRQIGGGTVQRTASGWRMSLPEGSKHSYRLAQMDDYARAPRSRLIYKPPCTIRLRARVSAESLPGTWGFGLWNDPFGLSLGLGAGKPGRLPTLPQTAWFMHASEPNWLSFKDDDNAIPANGFFAGVFRSPGLPGVIFTPALLALPLSFIRPASRLLRRIASRIIRQESAALTFKTTDWHEYSFRWELEHCRFSTDGVVILKTSVSPHPPLGLVIWIDNQYAAWTPRGRLGYGTLENPSAWIEIEGLEAQSG